MEIYKEKHKEEIALYKRQKQAYYRYRHKKRKDEGVELKEAKDGKERRKIGSARIKIKPDFVSDSDVLSSEH